ncbi:MAG: thiolase domain-containing protein [Anaerolineae bacterium]
MRDVSIIGIGQTPVREHWNQSLRELATRAIVSAMADAGAGPDDLDALYVGNMASGALIGQEHLGALVADYAGLRGVEAIKVEAAAAAGGAAFRQGYLSVAGGLHNLVVVVGVEKMTDKLNGDVTSALATSADADFEADHGLSFAALNALLMRRYMHEYDLTRLDFARFAINAHQNAVHNPNAMFPFELRESALEKARMVADPITMLDSCAVADGAAAVVLCPSAMAQTFTDRPVRVRASSLATDTLAIHSRRDPLFLEGAATSAARAYEQAGVGPDDIDLFELHDAFGIMAALSLEAAGFADRGRAVHLAQDCQISHHGRIPIQTMGGLKARGHPAGATGIYQIVDAATQLRGEAGGDQLPDARLGMTQNIGGTGATVVTHILEAI